MLTTLFWGYAAMYGMIMESSRPNTRLTNLGLQAVQHTKVSQKAKTNGGGGGNNIRDHKGKNSASTYSIQFSSLFIPVMLLVGYLF